MDPPPQPGAASLAGRTIVLLEDDELVRRATERMLRRLGALVVAGANSREVLDTLAQNELTPASVIADYWLSRDEDGVTAALAIRQKTGPSLQGLIITGDTSEEVVHRIAKAGFQLLRKPVNVSAFLSALVQDT